MFKITVEEMPVGGYAWDVTDAEGNIVGAGMDNYVADAANAAVHRLWAVEDWIAEDLTAAALSVEQQPGTEAERLDRIEQERRGAEARKEDGWEEWEEREQARDRAAMERTGR